MAKKKKSKKEFKNCKDCKSPKVCKAVKQCLQKSAEEKIGGKKAGMFTGKQPGY